MKRWKQTYKTLPFFFPKRGDVISLEQLERISQKKDGEFSYWDIDGDLKVSRRVGVFCVQGDKNVCWFQLKRTDSITDNLWVVEC